MPDLGSYKKDLEEFREEVKARLESIKDLTIEEIATRADAIETIYEDCSSFFVNHLNHRGLIQRLLTDCYRQLGSPPEGSEHAIIALGSLSLGTMTPWSDLEFGILVNRSEYKEYFRNLSKLLQIKVVNLGETHLKGLGVESLNNFKTGDEEDEWFWDDVIKIKFNFDSTRWDACKIPLGRQGGYKVVKKVKNEETGTEETVTVAKPDYELILTPDEMAAFQMEPARRYSEEHKGRRAGEDQNTETASSQQNWFESDKHLVQALRTVSLIGGSQELLDEYRSKAFRVENPEILKARALQILKEDVDKFSLKLGDKEEGRLIDSKMDIYRLGDRVINSLANYYDITAEPGAPKLSIWQMIKTLQQEGHISPVGAQHLKEAVAIATELRLKAYSHNDTRSESVSTYIPAVEHLTEERRRELIEETFHMADTSILHHFYYVMLKVQSVINAFCNRELHEPAETLLKNDNLFADSNYAKGMVHARFLEYDRALKYMEAARREQPENLELLQNLLFLYLKTQTVESETGIIKNIIIIAETILKLTKSEHENEPNHPSIAISYNNLGEAYRLKKEFEQAIENYEEALKIKYKFYYSEHPSIAQSLGNIGVAFEKQGKYDEAMKTHQHALKIMLEAHKSKPSHHSDIAKSYGNLGAVYESVGKYDKAIENYQLALNEMLEAHKSRPNHPDIAKCYSNLGAAYERNREYDLAIENHQIALNIRLEAHKNNPFHAAIVSSYNSLGNTYDDKGEYDKAIENHLKALNILLKAPKSNLTHLSIASIYSNLGVSYESQGEYDLAIKHHLNALKKRRIAHKNNENHLDIGKSYNNLSAVYESKGEYDKERLYAKKALGIFSYNQNQEYFNLAKSLYDRSLMQLGNLSLLASREDEAMKYYCEMNPIFKKINIDFYSEIFIRFQLQHVAHVYSGNLLLSAINCQEVLVKVDPELKHGNHYYNLACFYAAQGNVVKANDAFIKALEYLNVTGGLHVEYAQFLVLNKGSKELIISPQEISDHLYAAINSTNLGGLEYGQMEKNIICDILKNLLKEKGGSISVDPKALAYYLLIKYPEFIASNDSRDSLMGAFRKYCNGLQDDKISPELLEDCALSYSRSLVEEPRESKESPEDSVGAAQEPITIIEEEEVNIVVPVEFVQLAGDVANDNPGTGEL